MQIRVSTTTMQFIFIAAGTLVAAAFLYVHFQFKLNLQDEYYDNARNNESAQDIAEMVAGTKTDEQEFKLCSFRFFKPAGCRIPGEHIHLFAWRKKTLESYA